MKILVTGGLGVNGSWVTRKLIQRGIRPVIIDQSADLALVGDHAADHMDLVVGDFTDPDTLDQGLRTGLPDAIIHLAALVGTAEQDPLETARVNIQGTVQLLDLARRHGIRRFVYTSSRAVYGGLEGPNGPPEYRPKREDDPCAPVRVYDVCKYAAEGMGRNYARLFGLEFVALRFATIFGPGKTLRHGNYAVLSRLIEGGLSRTPVLIPQGGEQQDDMIYVDDVAEATVLAALHPRPSFTEYNISRGIGATLHDLADAVRQVAATRDLPIEIGPGLDPLGFGINYCGILDNSRARQDLGFAPRFDLPAAVADYAREKQRLHAAAPADAAR